MEIRDKKLRDAILSLPGSFELYKQHSSERFANLEKQVDELKYTDLTNGDGKRVKTAKLIPAMYRDIQSVKEATEFLVDFAKLHKIFKKYRLYWFFIVTGLLLVGMSSFDIVKVFLSKMI